MLCESFDLYLLKNQHFNDPSGWQTGKQYCPLSRCLQRVNVSVPFIKMCYSFRWRRPSSQFVHYLFTYFYIALFALPELCASGNFHFCASVVIFLDVANTYFINKKNSDYKNIFSKRNEEEKCLHGKRFRVNLRANFFQPEHGIHGYGQKFLLMSFKRELSP